MSVCNGDCHLPNWKCCLQPKLTFVSLPFNWIHPIPQNRLKTRFSKRIVGFTNYFQADGVAQTDFLPDIPYWCKTSAAWNPNTCEVTELLDFILEKHCHGAKAFQGFKTVQQTWKLKRKLLRLGDRSLGMSSKRSVLMLFIPFMGLIISTFSNYHGSSPLLYCYG